MHPSHVVLLRHAQQRESRPRPRGMARHAQLCRGDTALGARLRPLGRVSRSLLAEHRERQRLHLALARRAHALARAQLQQRGRQLSPVLRPRRVRLRPCTPLWAPARLTLHAIAQYATSENSSSSPSTSVYCDATTADTSLGTNSTGEVRCAAALRRRHARPLRLAVEELSVCQHEEVHRLCRAPCRV